MCTLDAEDARIGALLSALPRLNEKDRTFAASLMSQWADRGLSEKQWPWVDTLAARGNGAGEQNGRTKTALGDLSGLQALFATAMANGLKQPAITLDIEGAGTIKIKMAGAAARFPGTLNVQTEGAYGESTWYGRILKDGNFEASPRVRTPEQLIPGLQALAADPAKVASVHGRKTGECCFCARELTDKRSIFVGYGPVCSDNFGLHYPSLSEIEALEEAA
jgi:hypothetical protein